MVFSKTPELQYNEPFTELSTGHIYSNCKREFHVHPIMATPQLRRHGHHPSRLLLRGQPEPSRIRRHRRSGGHCRPGGGSTLHRAGQMEVVPNQLHALSIHELVRRQDLAQHPLAAAERLQNLSKAWTSCNRAQHSGPRQPTAVSTPSQVPFKAATDPAPQGVGEALPRETPNAQPISTS